MAGQVHYSREEHIVVENIEAYTALVILVDHIGRSPACCMVYNYTPFLFSHNWTENMREELVV